jgi:hypothetical protein
MAGGAVVDRRTAAVDILCDVRGDRLLAQLEDKIAGVITLFDTERHGLRSREQDGGVAACVGVEAASRIGPLTSQPWPAHRLYPRTGEHHDRQR